MRNLLPKNYLLNDGLFRVGIFIVSFNRFISVMFSICFYMHTIFSSLPYYSLLDITLKIGNYCTSVSKTPAFFLILCDVSYKMNI